MLTSLSRTFRRIFDTALGRTSSAASSPRAQSPAAASVCDAPAPPALRLVRSGAAPSAERDNSIRVTAQVGAAAFVAGAGARLYSLDAFRHSRGGNPTRPRHPRAA